MKISVDDEELFTLSEIQKRVIKNDIHSDEFEQDMRRRLHYILTHKYERCFERLYKEWIPKLQASGATSIPLNNDDLSQMIFSHPEYLDRKSREQVISASQ